MLQMHPSSAEQTGKMTFLDLLATLFLVQDTAGAHVLLVHQDPQVLFSPAAFQSVFVPGLIPPLLQDIPLPFVEDHEVPVSPLLHPVKISLLRVFSAPSLGH